MARLIIAELAGTEVSHGHPNRFRRLARGRTEARATGPGSELLPSLLNIPHSQSEWDQFSWNHRLSHDKIRSAVLAQFKLSLTDYQIDPISPGNIQQFLQNNSSLHNDMNTVLGLPGIDLLDVDLSKDNERDSWLWFHFKEHFDAENKLGIGS
jgi:hypothetical protein